MIIVGFVCIVILVGRWFFNDGIWDNTLSTKYMNFNMKNLNAIITGANSGVGFELTKYLVSKECNVILACRNASKAKIAINEISSQLSKIGRNNIGQMRFIELDLSDIKSVNNFITQVRGLNIPIHYLINNAGCHCVKYEITSDNFERCWQTNYLSPFLLTHKLVEHALKLHDIKLRIVNVTSKGHIHCNQIPYYHFDNIPKLLKADKKFYEKQSNKYVSMDVYHDTKLGNVLHAYKLQKILDTHNISHIQISSVHPGLINTPIFQWNRKPLIIRIIVTVLWPIFLMITRSKSSSIIPILHCMLSNNNDKNYKKGGYHSNCIHFKIGYGYSKTKHHQK